MARRLCGAGLAVMVYDVDAAAMARMVGPSLSHAGTLQELGAACDIAFFSLPTPEVVLHAAQLLAGTGGRLRIVVELSTCGPQAALAMAQMLAVERIEFVDAPVSGGIAGARDGTLSLMASGATSVVEQVLPLLQQLGKVYRVGSRAGDGQMMKLINNMLNASAIAATAEGMALGLKAGLDPARMIDVLNASTGRNSATQDKWPRAVLPRTFDYGFTTGLCAKDVTLCLDAAARLAAPMRLGGEVMRTFDRAIRRYGLQSDFTILAKLAEVEAGVVLQEETGR